MTRTATPARARSVRASRIRGDLAPKELVELDVDGVAGAADGLEFGGVELRRRS